MKLRVGRKVRKNLYIQFGDEPSDNDLDVGRVDSDELAHLIVQAVNDSGYDIEDWVSPWNRGGV